MNILLVGAGGREHALAWKIAQSSKCGKLYVAPGNDGMSDIAEIGAVKWRDSRQLQEKSTYEALSKNELLRLCTTRGIAANRNVGKPKLVELLEASDGVEA